MHTEIDLTAPVAAALRAKSEVPALNGTLMN
jgi:hypothetical protein